MLSQYVKVGQGGPPETREMVKARGRHVSGKGKKASSSSSNVGYVDVSRVRAGQRRGVGDEKLEALWQRAFDPVTLVPLDQYATSSMFEDPGDKRTAEMKYNWWGCIWPNGARGGFMCRVCLPNAWNVIWRR